MARKPEGPPPPPTVQRLRVHYAKRGRLRYSSHRDFQRAFERALRRAGVPMAYSAGFSPHPKVSYAGAAATGVASEAEYLEIGLAERCDPGRLRTVLDRSLPPDLDVLDVVEVAPAPENTKAPSLADRLEASVWRVTLAGLPPDVAQRAVDAFLAAGRVEVSRMTKNGLRTFDARAAVVALAVIPRGVPDPAGPCAILHLVVRHVTPAVRPDDVLAGLRQIGDLAPPTTPAVVRLAQGPLDESAGTVSDPLAPDRDAAGG
ncbi:MAG: TIGR03936 family radical SAM-associated protein [Actinomycetes bacterium]